MTTFARVDMSEGELAIESGEEGELELSSSNVDNIKNRQSSFSSSPSISLLNSNINRNSIKKLNALSQKKWKGIYLETDFIFDGKIGEGTFGQVYKAKFKNNPTFPHHVALKALLLRIEQEGFPITAIREIKLLRNLRHPNIIELLGIAISSSPVLFPSSSSSLPSSSSNFYPHSQSHSNLKLINSNLNALPIQNGRIKNSFPIETNQDHDQSKKLTRLTQEISNQRNDQDALEEEIIPSGVSMIFPYMDHDLTALLEDPIIPNFTIGQIKLYSYQLLSGLEYLHRVGILHRDIKGANILVDNRGQLKITDFGLARPLEEGRLEYTPGVVTRWYRPPELLLGSREYGIEVDIWGIGCIIIEMFTRKPLLPGSSDLDQIEKIVNLLGLISEESFVGCSKLTDYSKINWKSMKQKSSIKEILRFHSSKREDPSPTLIDLVSQMLKIDPKKRITAKDALSHGWFNEFPKMSLPHEIPTYRSRHDKQYKRERERERDELEQFPKDQITRGRREWEHERERERDSHHSHSSLLQMENYSNSNSNSSLIPSKKRPPHMTPQKHGEHESNKSLSIEGEMEQKEREEKEREGSNQFLSERNLEWKESFEYPSKSIDPFKSPSHFPFPSSSHSNFHSHSHSHPSDHSSLNHSPFSKDCHKLVKGKIENYTSHHSDRKNHYHNHSFTSLNEHYKIHHDHDQSSHSHSKHSPLKSMIPIENDLKKDRDRDRDRDQDREIGIGIEIKEKHFEMSRNERERARQMDGGEIKNHYHPLNDSSTVHSINVDRYIPDYSTIHSDYPNNRRNWSREDFFKKMQEKNDRDQYSLRHDESFISTLSSSFTNNHERYESSHSHHYQDSSSIKSRDNREYEHGSFNHYRHDNEHDCDNRDYGYYNSENINSDHYQSHGKSVNYHTHETDKNYHHESKKRSLSILENHNIDILKEEKYKNDRNRLILNKDKQYHSDHYSHLNSNLHSHQHY